VVCFGGPVAELGGDLESGLDGERGQLLEDQGGDSGVDTGSAHRLARPCPRRDPLALTEVVRHRASVATLVIADGHALAALPADDQSLQQRRSFPGRSGPTLLTVGRCVGRQRGLVRFETLEADVVGVGAGNEDGPLVPGLDHRPVPPLGVGDLASAAIEVGAGKEGVVQYKQDVVVAQWHPVQLAGMGAAEVPGGEPDPFCGEGLHHGAGRSGGLEGGEEVSDRPSDAGVGIECDRARCVVDEADG
jgi:hypothetical protein